MKSIGEVTLIKHAYTADISVRGPFRHIGRPLGAKLASLHPRTGVTVYITSNGGDLEDGMVAYRALRRREGCVMAVILDQCGSAATLPILAASKISIVRDGSMLIHSPHYPSLHHADVWKMRTMTARLERSMNEMLDLYVQRTGMARSDMRNLMEQNRWIKAQEALEYGLVDEVLGWSTNDLFNAYRNKFFAGSELPAAHFL